MTLEAFAARFPGWTCRDHLARADTLGKLYNDYEARLADYIRESARLGRTNEAYYDHLALTCNALGWAREQHMQAARSLAPGTGDQK